MTSKFNTITTKELQASKENLDAQIETMRIEMLKSLNSFEALIKQAQEITEELNIRNNVSKQQPT